MKGNGFSLKYNEIEALQQGIGMGSNIQILISFKSLLTATGARTSGHEEMAAAAKLVANVSTAPATASHTPLTLQG
eukprot:1150675-Pelagomonas_calceolata.AAC.3